jgi:hypothetical protein
MELIIKPTLPNCIWFIAIFPANQLHNAAAVK